MGRALELNSEFNHALATYQDMESLAKQREDRAMALASLIARVTIEAVPSAIHDPEEARTLGERALILSRELDDQTAQAKILWSLSLANFFINRLPEAIEYGERSLALARGLDLREQTAQTLNDLGGLIYLHSGRVPQAIEALQEASRLWDELGNRPMLADSLSGSATAHLYVGEYARAIDLSQQALEISRSIKNLWGQSYSQIEIGEAFRQRGEYGQAIAVTEECIRLGERAGFIVSRTYPQAKLALIYAELGDLDYAFELTGEALKVAEKHELRIASAAVFGTLARLQIMAGHLAEAANTIGEAKGWPWRESWKILRLPVLIAEAELAIQQGDGDRALAATDDLISRLRQYGMRSELPEALYLEGGALLDLGQEEAARDRFREARAEAESLGVRRILWRILNALSRLETDPIKSEQLRREAREVIAYVVDHIERDELRASFLSLPDVEAVV
jgi:tetratricopeptide (TPR) repeat protein